MLRIFWGFIILFIFTSTAASSTMYVSEITKITLRTGKGTENRIMAMIESGEAVNMLQEEDDWAYIRLSDGKEGWVLTRFLTKEVPSRIVLTKLEKVHAELTQRTDLLSRENNALKSENETLSSEIADLRERFTQLTSVHNELKTQSEHYIELKTEHDQLLRKYRIQSEEFNQLEEKYNSKDLKNYIIIFVTGAGVMFFGIILGYTSKRQKSKYTSNYGL